MLTLKSTLIEVAKKVLLLHFHFWWTCTFQPSNSMCLGSVHASTRPWLPKHSYLKSPSVLSKFFQMHWTAISLLLTFLEISFGRIFLFLKFHHYGIPLICMSKTAMTLSWTMLSFFFFQLGRFKHVCKLNNLTRSRSFSAVISPNRIRRKRSGSRCVLTLSQKCPGLIILFGF